jgi:hydrogenase maturation protein HypF
MSAERQGLRIEVRGIVQGVGFRPFVYAQAQRCGLTGWVRNTSGGVEMQVSGTQTCLQSFLHALNHDLPPLARIDSLTSRPCPPDGSQGFEIIQSQPRPDEFIPVSPDVATCPDCQAELFDPSDRRYRYPFTNCTNCGPRFTIIQDLPYDRPKTTMAGFEMCLACRSEYQNPLDRRFHAQPVACSRCGPQVWLEAGGQRLAERGQAIQAARHWLKQGKILAIKGLGGFHLACDACNPQAVDELRCRKQRSDKPFALMAFDLSAVQGHCFVSPEEAELLSARQRPVLLLDRRPESSVAGGVAPGQRTLGVMLAYTPLHLLLLEPEGGFPELLVMTSGNLSEEPIAYRDQEARQRLSGLADAFLLHDRPIHMRVDDSVARLAAGGLYPIRRARGYAPDPLSLPFTLPPLLATGAELKNTFCLTRGEYAFLSHHIGDLENYETLTSYEEGIAHFERLFRVKPEVIACDLHPDYLATGYARCRADLEGLPLVEVQHHHAHLAACLADNGWDSDEPAIGLSFDGTGLGTDGAVWGGEVLLGSYTGYRRMFHLAYAPLPGGEAAVHKPARMALAHLWQAGLPWETDLAPLKALSPAERSALQAMLDGKLNSPPTSSMGRLFDAASALLGVRQVATYEGQAAIELEALADPHEAGAYPFDIRPEVFDSAPLWQAMLSDLRARVSLPVIAARFHNSLVELSAELCAAVRSTTGVNTVALSGGVWQNRFLLERCLHRLAANGFRVLAHRRVPANDGGLALGQALIASRCLAKGEQVLAERQASL